MSENKSPQTGQWLVIALCLLSIAVSAYAAFTATMTSLQMHEMLQTISAIQTSQSEFLSSWNVDSAEFRESLDVNNAAIDELYSNQEMLADDLDDGEIDEAIDIIDAPSRAVAPAP